MRYLAAGILLIASSAGVMLAARFVLPATGFGVSSILVYVAGGLGLAFSFRFLKRGLRSLQPSAQEILRKDGRPPILYLRSFIDDPTSQKMTRVKLGVAQFVPDPAPRTPWLHYSIALGPLSRSDGHGSLSQKQAPIGSMSAIPSGRPR